MSGTATIADSYLVDGKRLEAVRVEVPHSRLPTIVMLHEGLGSVAHWRDFPSQLAEQTGASIFVYSRYGHGNSDPLGEPRSPSYMHHEAHIVLPELLDKTRIERPVLLGHSDGASIAILYAGMFPATPAGLVLEAPHVFVEDVTVSSIAHARQLYTETDLPQKLGRYHSHVDSLFWGWNNIWLDARFRTWNIESFLDSIRCPVLVLQGAQDEYGTAAQIEAIRRRIPSASAIIFNNCKHAPHRDQCQLTLSAINQFLRSVLTAQH
jgi:pimeloyl-ACP methyl ester carboxylesterase